MYISALLTDDFEWEENDYDKAQIAWQQYNALREEEKLEIAERMIDKVRDSIASTLDQTLRSERKRETRYLVLEVHTTAGEVRKLLFKSIDEALAFFKDFDIDRVFDSANCLTIFDEPDSGDRSADRTGRKKKPETDRYRMKDLFEDL